jgi:hypothetical protein
MLSRISSAKSSTTKMPTIIRPRAESSSPLSPNILMRTAEELIEISAPRKTLGACPAQCDADLESERYEERDLKRADEQHLEPGLANTFLAELKTQAEQEEDETNVCKPTNGPNVRDYRIVEAECANQDASEEITED